MNVGVRVAVTQRSPELLADIARIERLWNDGLARFGGPFLAGDEFCAVDAFFAPVVYRFRTYGVAVNGAAAGYLETMLAHPAMQAWEADARTRELQLAVNVSGRQFRQQDFVAQVSEVLERTAIDPMRLKLELTESIVLDNVEDTIAKMHALRQLGVSFSMDDFGTGYSSLAYLTQLPLNQLKIDKSFVQHIGSKASDSTIIQTIIGMADNLGMEVIAEGVETQEQRDFLEANGCMLYQGYLFGKPVPCEEFDALLRAN